MKKIKFLKQSSVVFLLSLSLLVGCGQNRGASEDSDTPDVTIPKYEQSLQKYDELKEEYEQSIEEQVNYNKLKKEYDKLKPQYEQLEKEYEESKTQAKDDWKEFQTAWDSFQKEYQEGIDSQLKQAIPPKKDSPSPNPSPPTLPMGKIIDINNTFRPVRKAYNDLIENHVNSPKSVLNEAVKQKIIAIGGDLTTQAKPEEAAKNQAPLRQIERVLWPLKGGLELTRDQAKITAPAKKQEIENKRIEEIQKVQQIVQASPVDGLYGQGTYDKIKSYLEQQFTDIKGENDTKIDSLETAIITKDTAFISAPEAPELPSRDWRKGALLIILVVGGAGFAVWFLLRHINPEGSTTGGTTETQTPPQKPPQKLLPKRQLFDDDSAVLFTAMGHALNQRGIETNIYKQGITLEALVYLLQEERIKQEIIEMVKSDLPSSKGGSSLGSHIVQRVVDSNRLNQKISLLNPYRKQEIRNIIQEELQRLGYVQGDAYEGANSTREVLYQDSNQTQDSLASLPNLVQQRCNFYNNKQKQKNGEVAKYFEANAIKLGETNESYNRRTYNSLGTQDIELETVGKNRGGFWVIILEENSSEGWLFPKLKKTTAIHEVVKTLFEVEGDLFDYRYIEVIEPAQMVTSDLEIWTLRKPGKILLYK